MNYYIQALVDVFEQHRNPQIAEGQKAYMLHQFLFLGITTPLRRQLCKQHCQQMPFLRWPQLHETILELWQMPYREYHYAAVQILAHHKKMWPSECIHTLEHCLVHQSWWDTVDLIASDCLTDYFKRFPEAIASITPLWNASDNIWLQRSSIMFQKAFKHQTDTQLLAAYILNCAESKAFFVQKAIGWALREYAKTNAAWVQTFVNTHALPPLSKREALKHFR
jgi:3-methyladenine DNA glycosylase AlkD